MSRCCGSSAAVPVAVNWLLPVPAGKYSFEPVLGVAGIVDGGGAAVEIGARGVPGVARVDRGGVFGEVEVVVEAAVVTRAGGVVTQHVVGAVGIDEERIGGGRVGVLAAGGLPICELSTERAVPEAGGCHAGAAVEDVVIGGEAGLAVGGDVEVGAGVHVEDVVAEGDVRRAGDADGVADGLVDRVVEDAARRWRR